MAKPLLPMSPKQQIQFLRDHYFEELLFCKDEAKCKELRGMLMKLDEADKRIAERRPVMDRLLQLLTEYEYQYFLTGDELRVFVKEIPVKVLSGFIRNLNLDCILQTEDDIYVIKEVKTS